MIPFFAPIEPNSQNFCRKFAEFFVVQYKYKVLSDVFFQNSVLCLIFFFCFFFQFRDVGTQQYLKTESIKSYLHGIMSDYFMGTWANGRQKPFKYEF